MLAPRPLAAALALAALLAACGDDGAAAPAADTINTLDTSPADASPPEDTATPPEDAEPPGDLAPDTAAPADTALSPDSAPSDATPGDTGPPAGCPVDVAPGPGLVVTDLGAVHGVAEGAGWVWRGVPYAAPPTDERRWRAPELPPCYTGVFEADTFAPSCPQRDDDGATVGDEDCLALNVWAPPGALTPGALPRPVLVFLHGGGNVQGSGAETFASGGLIYDGRRLAAAVDALVVTLNYRLGPFGFLALPEMLAEGPASGNFGLLDQIAALSWVSRNIAAFGGDPGRVLLFGESAGAADTCSLLASPLAAGLFHAALAQSGSCSVPPGALARAGMSDRVDAETPCAAAPDRLACLRALSTAEVMAALPGDVSSVFSATVAPPDYGRMQAIVDGHVLLESPLDALAAGRHHPVPFAIGTNAEELAEGLTPKVQTAAGYEARVRAAFGAFGAQIPEQILVAYPVTAFATPQDALVAVFSDARFTCPARTIARAAATADLAPVYRYLFARRAVTPSGDKPATHGIELLFLFGSFANMPLFTPAADDVAVSAAMQGYWGRLAATGDPNGAGATPWPAYDPATDPYLRLDAPLSAATGLATARCDLWDSLRDALAP